MQYASPPAVAKGWEVTIAVVPPGALRKLFVLALKAERQDRAPLTTTDVLKTVAGKSATAPSIPEAKLATVVRFLQLLALDVRTNALATSDAVQKKLSKLVSKACSEEVSGSTASQECIDALTADEEQIAATAAGNTLESPAVGKTVLGEATSWTPVALASETNSGSSTGEGAFKTRSVARVNYMANGGQMEQFEALVA